MVKGKFCKTSQYYENGCIQVVYQKYRDKRMGYFINGVINNDEKLLRISISLFIGINWKIYLQEKETIKPNIDT